MPRGPVDTGQSFNSTSDLRSGQDTQDTASLGLGLFLVYFYFKIEHY